jgi:predicted nucleotidyltransferase
VTAIRVFGSFARGEATENSDLDLLIESEGARTPFFPRGFILDLEEELGRRVDVATEASLHPLIRRSILQEAAPF